MQHTRSVGVCTPVVCVAWLVAVALSAVAINFGVKQMTLTASTNMGLRQEVDPHVLLSRAKLARLRGEMLPPDVKRVVNEGDLKHVHLCRPNVSLGAPRHVHDSWQTFALDTNTTLHLLEVEILPSGSHRHIISMLAVISNNTLKREKKQNGKKSFLWELWPPKVTAATVTGLRCVAGASSSDITRVRSLHFVHRVRVRGSRGVTRRPRFLGMLLQCELGPSAAKWVNPGYPAMAHVKFSLEFQRANVDDDIAGIKHAATANPSKQFGVHLCGAVDVDVPPPDTLSLCTVSQFSQHSPAALKEWIEYHRLLGVGRIHWLDRLGGSNATGKGSNFHTLAPYIKQGLVIYASGVYHAPLDYNVYVDQAYTNTACYMRLRHRFKWIATIDIDEFIDVQPRTPPAEGDNSEHDAAATHTHNVRAQQSATDAALGLGLVPFLESLHTNFTEVNLMHCKMVAKPAGAGRKWRSFARHASGRLIDTARATGSVPNVPTHPKDSTSGVYRNCRPDVPAGKAIGRAAAVPFSHVHFLWPGRYEVNSRAGAAPKTSGCFWLWHGQQGSARKTPGLDVPASCSIVADYPQVKKRPVATSVFQRWAGFNHAGGSLFIKFKGKQFGGATPAFANISLNKALGLTFK